MPSRDINKHHAFAVVVVICIGLVLSILIGGSWLLIERMRQSSLSAAQTTIQNAASTIERVVNRHLLQVDAALANLPDLFVTAAHVGQALDAASASRLLNAFNYQTFNLRDIVLVQNKDRIWASARPNPRGVEFPASLLAAKRETSTGTSSLVGPVRNLVTGEWDILLIRPLSLPGIGALDGVAEIPLPLLSALFTAVPEFPGLRIALEHRSGQLIISQPYNDEQIGKPQRISPRAMAHDGTPFMLAGSLTNAPAFSIVRPTLYPDLMIVVQLDLHSAMDNWVRDRNRLIAVVALTMVLLSALAAILLVARRARERVEAERNRARIVLESAIEAMSDAFVMWDSESRLVLCNNQFREMYSVSADFIYPGAAFEDIVRGGTERGQYPEAECDAESFVRTTVAWHLHNDGPMERRLPGGRWALITERKIPGGGRVGIRTDITDQKQALANLEAANQRAHEAMAEARAQNTALQERDRALHIQNVLFDAALNNMSQGLLMVDGNQRLIVHNSRFLALFGVDRSTVVSGLAIEDLFARLTAAGQLPSPIAENIHIKQRYLADAAQPGALVITSPEGRAIAVSQQPLPGGGWVATYEDVSEQRRAEEQIRFAAHHDALTKLPNRTLFRNRLDELVGRMDRRQTRLAVLYLDLDRFKQVNDTLGHSVGDALLEAASRRLLGCVRATDIVARLGGDEFAIAHTAAASPASATTLGNRIIKALSGPYNLNGHTVVIGASIGIALANDPCMDAETLLRNSDMALYQAKAQGRGVCVLFEPDMEQQLRNRLAIEEDLREALQRNEFELWYQPLWDLASDACSGFEALIRWRHPSRGTVSPAVFIPIVEETGLIKSIGRWVVERACADAARWPSHTKVAVNLSAAQFDNGDIFDVVASALERTTLPASRLELEITETVLLKNNEQTLASLFRLRALGVRIALDDFGIGFSSLSYLRSFPFDKLKIDQSFVREMESRNDCRAIVGSIVSLARELRIITTAEGVETADHLALVRAAGCTEAQGFLFSAPRPLAEAIKLVSPMNEEAITV